MSRIDVDLPENVVRWAESRVEAGQAPSIDAYFAELARRDREEAEEVARIQRLLDEADASGVDPRPGHQIMAEVRAEYFGPDS